MEHGKLPLHALDSMSPSSTPPNHPLLPTLKQLQYIKFICASEMERKETLQEFEFEGEQIEKLSIHSLPMKYLAALLIPLLPTLKQLQYIKFICASEMERKETLQEFEFEGEQIKKLSIHSLPMKYLAALLIQTMHSCPSQFDPTAKNLAHYSNDSGMAPILFLTQNTQKTDPTLRRLRNYLPPTNSCAISSNVQLTIGVNNTAPNHSAALTHHLHPVCDLFVFLA